MCEMKDMNLHLKGGFKGDRAGTVFVSSWCSTNDNLVIHHKEHLFCHFIIYSRGRTHEGPVQKAGASGKEIMGL